MINRRRIVTLLAWVAGGPASTSFAQGTTRARVVGLLMVNEERDAEGSVRAAAFRKGLAELGWVEGRNLQIHVLWGASDPDRAVARAERLLKLRPDVIVVNGSPALSALQRATHSVPIVFVVVTDPLGSGYVRSLGRPGGNITGFSTFAPEIGGKWLGLLKEISPGLKRVACILDPAFKGFTAIWREIQLAAPTYALRVSSIDFRENADDLESAVASFAKEPGGGLIVSPTAINNAARERIISLATHYRLPAIYPFQHFAAAGGLLVYGFEPRDLFERSARYVDRILKGEMPGNLPVQAPTKFEMIVNMKTARALGLTVPQSLLLRADEVVE